MTDVINIAVMVLDMFSKIRTSIIGKLAKRII